MSARRQPSPFYLAYRPSNEENVARRAKASKAPNRSSARASTNERNMRRGAAVARAPQARGGVGICRAVPAPLFGHARGAALMLLWRRLSKALQILAPWRSAEGRYIEHAAALSCRTPELETILPVAGAAPLRKSSCIAAARLTRRQSSKFPRANNRAHHHRHIHLPAKPSHWRR